MELSFDNRVIWTLFDGQLWITETIFNTWLIMIFLTVIAIIVHLKLKKFKDVPTGFQNVVELIVESMDNFVIGAMGPEYAYFANWFFGVFAFLLTANYAGLIGLRPPTTDLATTAALGLSTFVLIHFAGILTQKGKYFKKYFEPFPVFLPMNLIETVATPISLSFRMFGNILGAFIVLGMVYELLPIYVKVGIPSVLHAYFDVFAGSLQAFIFTILSLTFIREKLPEED